MKKKKIILTVALLSTVTLIGSVYGYNKAYANDDNDIKVVDYKAPAIINENGYQITKYENINANQWLDENRVIVLKDNGVYENPDAGIPMSYISVYDLNSKTYTDYKNIVMDTKDLLEISPDRRYVLYGEPRNIPKVSSDEWQKAVDSGELFKKKVDVLDLSTGEVIVDIDKTEHNYEAQYKWINQDYIFVDYGDKWKIIDKKGQSIKEGKFDFTGCDSNYSVLIDISEIKVEDNNINGVIYYTKDFMGEDRNLGSGVYSMDINTQEEKLITKNEYSLNAFKQENVIAVDYFNNNGNATGGLFLNRTFGFKLFNKDGKLVQNLEMPFGRNFDDLKLSPDGEKCAFIETNSCFNNNDKNTLNNSLKVMDVKSGEVKEITNVDKIMDKDNEESFYNYKVGDDIIRYAAGPIISNISWDNTGKSLMFNYEYTSKDDGENHTDTYVVTFDK